jgi:hypothetical protein
MLLAASTTWRRIFADNRQDNTIGRNDIDRRLGMIFCHQNKSILQVCRTTEAKMGNLICRYVVRDQEDVPGGGERKGDEAVYGSDEGVLHDG